MVKAEEKRETNNPSDLLHRLVISKFPIKSEESTDDEESIELSLGLSLNGRFGVDPIRAKILNRSSSVSDFVSKNEESNMACVGPPLIRTCSLPTESEEEWRKRKEIQSLRRMEAKKKRIEKLRNGRNQSDFVENFLKSQRKVVGIIPSIPSLQGSIGSRGSGSSGTSESGNQPNQGMTGCNETISPASVQSPAKQGEQKPVLIPPTESSEFVGAAIENPSVNNAEATEIMRNMMVDMPCVSTRVAGPDGKRVEGFLYRYRKGEQVRIVCVCHGSFLTPAEFVKHGGGGDVSHPLKHIVVNPSPLL